MEKATIVSKGMRWERSQAQKAVEGHFYFKVGEKGGQLLLSGAPGRWRKPEYAGYIYIPTLRLAGNPEEIRSVLQSQGMQSNQVEDYINSAYTSQNYSVSVNQGGLKEHYDNEVNQYLTFKNSQTTQKGVSDGPTVSLEMLAYLVDNLPQATTGKTSTRPKLSGQTRVTSPVKRSGRKISLTTRLQQLQPNKVLDVSNMKDEGTGIKSIDKPGPGSKKIGLPEWPIVSSHADKYSLALELLGIPSDQMHTYMQRFNQLAQQGETQHTSVKTSTLPSVPVVPAVTNQHSPTRKRNPLPHIPTQPSTVLPHIPRPNVVPPLTTGTLPTVQSVAPRLGQSSPKQFPQLNPVGLTSMPSVSSPRS